MAATRRAALANGRTAPRARARPLSMAATLTVALVVIGLAALVPLLQRGQAVTTADNVRQLERLRNDWEARIQELEAEIASLTALDRVEKDAQERLGMQAPQEIIYLTVDLPSPEHQPVPARFLPPKEESPKRERSWWQFILDLLPFP